MGISADVAGKPDTGPSVLITAMVIYLAIVHRAPIVGCLTAVMMIGEVVIHPNLTGREHLIGMATAAASPSPHISGPICADHSLLTDSPVR